MALNLRRMCPSPLLFTNYVVEGYFFFRIPPLETASPKYHFFFFLIVVALGPCYFFYFLIPEIYMTKDDAGRESIKRGDGSGRRNETTNFNQIL